MLMGCAKVKKDPHLLYLNIKDGQPVITKGFKPVCAYCNRKIELDEQMFFYRQEVVEETDLE